MKRKEKANNSIQWDKTTENIKNINLKPSRDGINEMNSDPFEEDGGRQASLIYEIITPSEPRLNSKIWVILKWCFLLLPGLKK